MSLAKIQSALIAGYMAALPSLSGEDRTQYENREFKPPSNREWCRVSFLPGSTAPATLGNKGEDRDSGILQIDLNAPLNSGRTSQEANYDFLRAYFHAGRYLEHQGQHVVIRSCSRAPSSREGGWHKVPVSVSWYAHSQRADSTQ